MTMGVYFNNNYERGFGTFPLKGNACKDAIVSAVNTGFRAFDTAQMYNNETETGDALKSTGVGREDFFLTTKVDNANYSAQRFLPSVENSLKRLQTDYVDVLLLHWPPADFIIEPVLELLASAYKENYARHIGVSNFTAQMMRDTKSFLDIPIAVNQVEFHPLLNQDILLSTSTETGIPLAAYCSIARGEIFNYPILAEIGEQVGKSAAQVAQRWTLQKGVSINTMSTSPTNIKANFEINDFELNEEQMAAVDKLTATNHRIVNKSVVPFAPDFD